MVSGSTALKGAAAVLLLLLLIVGAVGAYAITGGFEQPTVEETEVRWGEISDDTSNIRATVVVNNPNDFGIPSVITIAYSASLNDVTIADGKQSGVGLAPGRNVLELTIPVENDKIPEWWVTHINRDERSTLTIEAAVRTPIGLSIPLPAQEQSLDTDILGAFGGEEPTGIALFGEPFLVVGEQTASWGEATGERTPVTFTATVTNEHDRPMTFDGVGYVIEMNGITMGEGQDRTAFTVAPGETETLEIPASLETDRIDDWWVSHLNRDERTNLTVETYAIVEGGQNDPSVDLTLIELELDLQTDLLGGGDATPGDVSSEVGGDLAFEAPTVAVGELAWGEVTDATTELETTLELQNPNTDTALNELVDVVVRQRATINGVRVANNSTRIEDLPTGLTSVTLTTHLDNGKVPAWWARHVNNGETSTVAIDSSAVVDVGVTTLDLDLTAQQRQFSTDLLGAMNGDRDETITFQGSPAATVLSTSASWGQATPQETPIDAGVTIRNERQRSPVTVSDIAYTITMNGVTVGEGTDPVSLTMQPGETDTLDFTMLLDSTKMADWWVTHIENDEQTTISVELTATVEVGGETEQVTLDFLGGDATMETDILGTG